MMSRAAHAEAARGRCQHCAGFALEPGVTPARNCSACKGSGRAPAQAAAAAELPRFLNQENPNG